MILGHAPRYPESMVRLRGIYPIHPVELLPKFVDNPAETAPKREYELRGRKWPIPWPARSKIIMSSSGEKSVGPVLFDMYGGGSVEKAGFSVTSKLRSAGVKKVAKWQ